MSAAREESLGQLVIVGFDVSRWTISCERFLSRCRPGGVLLRARLADSPQATSHLLRKISLAVGTPLFLALEEEGGKLDPLGAILPPLPSARAAAQKGLAAVARLGELAGAALKLLGFNTNFAPVLDLSTALSVLRRDTRTFGSGPAQVARCGKAFVRGLQQNRVLACGKHFPGAGEARADGESKSPLVGKPMVDLWRQDLVPYRQLLPRLPMVLMSHAAYKAYDLDLPCPAGLSIRVVEGLLRIRLGYRKLAVAERLEEEAVRAPLDIGEAAVKSVNAGCDLLLVQGERNVEAILTGLKKGVESGKLPARRIQQALKRIHLAKKGLSLPGGRISAKAFDQLVRQFENFSKEWRPEERKIA